MTHTSPDTTDFTHEQDAIRATIRATIAQLQALLDAPPESGLDDGYTVHHLIGNSGAQLNDDRIEGPDFTDPDCFSETALDPAEPYDLVTTFTDTWEHLGEVVSELTSPSFPFLCAGMTQAILIVRGPKPTT